MQSLGPTSPSPWARDSELVQINSARQNKTHYSVSNTKTKPHSNWNVLQLENNYVLNLEPSRHNKLARQKSATSKHVICVLSQRHSQKRQTTPTRTNTEILNSKTIRILEHESQACSRQLQYSRHLTISQLDFWRSEDNKIDVRNNFNARGSP